MTDETLAPAGEGNLAPSSPPADTTSPISESEAGRALAQRRWAARNPASADNPAAEPTELAEQANAAPETDPGEQATMEAEPETDPPIEPPRSWTKAEKERWQSLPRETQEYLQTREQERERDFRRSQNEVAEQRKAVEADRLEAKRAREEYEAKLPALKHTLQSGDFADIRNMADVKKLQTEDPFRFQAYQVHQWELQAAQQEISEAEARQTKERESELASYRQQQDERFAEYAPEMKDPKKGAEIREKAVNALTADVGFTAAELNEFASNPAVAKLLFHSGFQRLLYDHLKLSDSKAAVPAKVSKPVPQVQKPGVSRPANADADARVQALKSKLETSGDVEDAGRLLAARRAARR